MLLAFAVLVLSRCRQRRRPRQQLAMEPLKDSGSNIYPAFEGWYQNADGTFTLLIGYYNRNKKEVLDIPIGPENKIEPGGPDQGQPTHFEVGRGWGTIAIKVPKDFGDKKLVWTLTANGKTVSVPFGVTKGYQIEPFLDAAMGNKPPTIKFSETGTALTGPPPPLSARAGRSTAPSARTWRSSTGSPMTATKSRRPVDRPPRRLRLERAAGPAAPPARQHHADEVSRPRRDQVRRQHADDREGHGQHDRDVLAAG